MVLSRIPEERRTVVRNRKKPLDKYNASKKQRQNKSNSSETTSLTTAVVYETLSTTSSSATDDTLSMISTPWSTETWRSPSPSGTRQSSFMSRRFNSEVSSMTTATVEPRTTSTCGPHSPEVSGSNITVTLLGDLLTPSSGSRYVQPLKRQYSGSTPTYTSWSLETYTSTGLVSTWNPDGLKVNYPWSPSTFKSDTDISDFYPSSLTLISQKGSRVGFGKSESKKPQIPMNVVVTKDDHPLLDWILVKQNGIPIRKD